MSTILKFPSAVDYYFDPDRQFDWVELEKRVEQVRRDAAQHPDREVRDVVEQACAGAERTIDLIKFINRQRGLTHG